LTPRERLCYGRLIGERQELKGASTMRGKFILAGLLLSLSSAIVSAQDVTAVPNEKDLYCAGTVTSEAVPRDTYLITGEESSNKIVFNTGDLVYINKGASQGVKVGDQFSVIRPVENRLKVDWTKWQSEILKKMGTVWDDEGRLVVTVVRPDLSIARVIHGCDALQRGDIVLPFMERPAPPLRLDSKVDQFAPLTGKPLAMVITAKNFLAEVGTDDIVYVNLGSAQGVKVGDHFRICQYTGTQHEGPFQTQRYDFDVDGDFGPTVGYGRAPAKYNWTNVPRRVLGEGLVLRTGPNSSTVLVTASDREIFAGAYVELE
jgi:hypothetical protein